jgi:hypothetical protein
LEDVKKKYRSVIKETSEMLGNTRFFPAIVKRSVTIDEMARDEARHGRALKGLLDRYFG